MNTLVAKDFAFLLRQVALELSDQYKINGKLDLTVLLLSNHHSGFGTKFVNQRGEEQSSYGAQAALHEVSPYDDSQIDREHSSDVVQQHNPFDSNGGVISRRHNPTLDKVNPNGQVLPNISRSQCPTSNRRHNPLNSSDGHKLQCIRHLLLKWSIHPPFAFVPLLVGNHVYFINHPSREVDLDSLDH